MKLFAQHFWIVGAETTFVYFFGHKIAPVHSKSNSQHPYRQIGIGVMDIKELDDMIFNCNNNTIQFWKSDKAL